jgi:hypothetical protein
LKSDFTRGLQHARAIVQEKLERVRDQHDVDGIEVLKSLDYELAIEVRAQPARATWKTPK